MYILGGQAIVAAAATGGGNVHPSAAPQLAPTPAPVTLQDPHEGVPPGLGRIPQELPAQRTVKVSARGSSAHVAGPRATDVKPARTIDPDMVAQAMENLGEGWLEDSGLKKSVQTALLKLGSDFENVLLTAFLQRSGGFESLCKKSKVRRADIDTLAAIFEDAVEGLESDAESEDAEGLEDAEELQSTIHEPTGTLAINRAVFEAAQGGRVVDLRAALSQAAPEILDEYSDERSGMTALTTVCDRGHAECLQLLLEAGMNINKPDRLGNTALISATFDNKIGCLRLLLAAGAHINIVDSSGSTAWDIAMADQQHLPTVALFGKPTHEPAHVCHSPLPLKCACWLF